MLQTVLKSSRGNKGDWPALRRLQSRSPINGFVILSYSLAAPTGRERFSMRFSLQSFGLYKASIILIALRRLQSRGPIKGFIIFYGLRKRQNNFCFNCIEHNTSLLCFQAHPYGAANAVAGSACYAAHYRIFLAPA